MDLKLLLFFWIFSGPVQSSVIKRIYWYKHQPRTWTEAHEFCRSEHNASLASVVTQSDINLMDLTKFQAWFGLKKEESRWTWVDGNYEFDSSNITTTAPQNHWGSWSGSSWDQDWWNTVDISSVFTEDEPQSGEECGRVTHSSLKAFGDKCDQRHFFFCEGWVWPYYDYYHFVPETLSWSEGLDFCKRRFNGYMRRVLWPVYQERDFPVWIGLHYDGDAWKWRDGTYSEQWNWAPGAPPAPAPAPGSCVVVSSQSKSMSVKNCSEAFPFLCYRHNVVLVQELLSWEQALETCRTLTPTNHSASFRMLSVEPSELKYAQSHAQGATSSKVWVGLRFLGGSWFWTDGGAVSLSLPQCPESGLHCGALVLNRTSGSDLIEPSDCSQRLNVLCYGEL